MSSSSSLVLCMSVDLVTHFLFSPPNPEEDSDHDAPPREDDAADSIAREDEECDSSAEEANSSDESSIAKRLRARRAARKVEVQVCDTHAPSLTIHRTSFVKVTAAPTPVVVVGTDTEQTEQEEEPQPLHEQPKKKKKKSKSKVSYLHSLPRS